MDLRPVQALIIVAVLVISGLVAGYVASQFELEPRAKAVSEPDLLESGALPDWAEEPMPDFSQHEAVGDKKDAFFGYMFPRLGLANLRIQAARAYAERLSEKETLSDGERDWLNERAKQLRIDPEDKQALFSGLERRLDIIPASMVLAQAANESSWGSSRFARRGNNLFGQWCFTEGCGLVPNSRPDGMNHEVKVFSSPYESIRGYLTNLNRHDAYRGIRERRAELRRDGQFPGGVALAGGLQAYSERGQAYVEEIRSMIHFNDLQRYDDRLEELLAADKPLDRLKTMVDDYRDRFSD